MELSDKLKKLGVEPSRLQQPVWAGPCSSKDNGGITFSLLSKFLVCRERFRCLVVDGIKPKPQFNHRLEYGNMWHLCEECTGNRIEWSEKLKEYAQKLMQQYRLQQEEVDKWYNVCKKQYIEYLKFWTARDIRTETEQITFMSESVFDVPYPLPSGRKVYLRGKWDELLIKEGGVWLKENKTKGEIDEIAIQEQLKYDLQTMLYLIAMCADKDEIGNTLDNLGLWWEDWSISGVVYNVVRRPLSGGKHTIVRHKGTKNKPEESYGAYYDRLQGLIREEPEWFFMRYDVSINLEDILSFRVKTFDNLLEQLCDWWEWIKQCVEEGTNPFSNPIHWQAPLGVFNPLMEGRGTDLDEFIRTGNMAGLCVSSELFEELKNA